MATNDSLPVWKSIDGSVVPYDDPTLKITMLKWQGRPDTNLEMTMFRVKTGQINDNDMAIAIALGKYKALTERQLRRMFRNRFSKEHEISTRLRFLQRVAWFDGFYVESEYNAREYVWTIGVAAQNYLRFVMGMQDLINPFFNSKRTRQLLGHCAINEMLLNLSDHGVVNVFEDMSYEPYMAPNVKNRPIALLKLNLPIGPIGMYLERIHQGHHPLRNLKNRLASYEEILDKYEKLPCKFDTAMPPIVVFSCSSEQVIRECVGSLDYWPDRFPILFAVDEHMGNITTAFRFVQKGDQAGEVTITPFNIL